MRGGMVNSRVLAAFTTLHMNTSFLSIRYSVTLEVSFFIIVPVIVRSVDLPSHSCSPWT